MMTQTVCYEVTETRLLQLICNVTPTIFICFSKFSCGSYTNQKFCRKLYDKLIPPLQTQDISASCYPSDIAADLVQAIAPGLEFKLKTEIVSCARFTLYEKQTVVANLFLFI